MEFRFVERLTEVQTLQLHRMFQFEWWTRGRSLEEVRKMLKGSDLVVGLCHPRSDELLAFARVLTDGVFKAFVFDLIVEPSQREHGLGLQLMDLILDHPRLTGVRQFELYCLPEMASFYRRWGFTQDVDGIVLMRKTSRGKPKA